MPNVVTGWSRAIYFAFLVYGGLCLQFHLAMNVCKVRTNYANGLFILSTVYVEGKRFILNGEWPASVNFEYG